MATATPGPQYPNGLTWTVLTPHGARAALLRGTVATDEQPINAIPRRQPPLSQTPSSPINRVPAAAAAEGAQHATSNALPDQAPQGEDQPISIAESANRAHQRIY